MDRGVLSPSPPSLPPYYWLHPQSHNLPLRYTPKHSCSLSLSLSLSFPFLWQGQQRLSEPGGVGEGHGRLSQGKLWREGPMWVELATQGLGECGVGPAQHWVCSSWFKSVMKCEWAGHAVVFCVLLYILYCIRWFNKFLRVKILQFCNFEAISKIAILFLRSHSHLFSTWTTSHHFCDLIFATDKPTHKIRKNKVHAKIC